MAEETETMQPGEAAGRNAEPLSAEPDTQEDVSERISKAVAEAKKEAEAELKKVRRELDSVKKAHMTEDEKKQADLTERERELAQREAELQNERSRMYAVKAIKKAGLDDGGDNALELVDFVLGDDEAQIDARVKAFGALVQKLSLIHISSDWISVKDRLPEESGDYLALQNSVNQYVLHFSSRHQAFNCYDFDEIAKYKICLLYTSNPWR